MTSENLAAAPAEKHVGGADGRKQEGADPVDQGQNHSFLLGGILPRGLFALARGSAAWSSSPDRIRDIL